MLGNQQAQRQSVIQGLDVRVNPAYDAQPWQEMGQLGSPSHSTLQPIATQGANSALHFLSPCILDVLPSGEKSLTLFSMKDDCCLLRFSDAFHIGVNLVSALLCRAARRPPVGRGK